MVKRPWLAPLLSFFVPGLGQIYNDDYAKGLAMLISVVAVFLVFGFGDLAMGLWILLELWAMVDAYVRARASSSGAEGGYE